jgi:cytosine/adenosine deaminase-related metal-dependent hydrolase
MKLYLWEREHIMSLFNRIKQAQAIIRRKGLYKQVSLYYRNDKIYAAYNKGFIRLMRSGSTSCVYISWEEIHDPLNHVDIETNKEPRYMCRDQRMRKVII